MTWDLKWRHRLVIQLFLLAAPLTITTNENASCPNGCTCEDVAVSCRGGNLTSLPLLSNPNNITHLIVSGQHGITNVGKELQRCVSLQLLNLSANNISVIEVGAFSDLRRLLTLILRRNYLFRLDTDIFKGLGGLKSLDLGYNGLNVLQNRSFSQLRSLRKLDFTKNNISVIETDAFKGLTSLLVLNLTRNGLKSLRSFSFSDLRSLEILVLDDNEIEALPEFAFSGLVSLQIIRLNGNRLTRISPMAFDLLTVNSSSVEELYLKGTSLTEFPKKAFERLHRLQILDLSQSKIKVFHNGSFDKLINLRKIFLVGLDNLTRIENFTFSWLFKLEELIISRNGMLETIGAMSMPSIQGNIRFVDFSHNSIKVFHKNMVEWDSDVTVDLTHNPIVCDCRTKWMVHTLPNAMNLTTRDNSANLTCASPLRLAGRRILSLPVSSFGCDGTPFDSEDADARLKTAAIAAAVTSILLIIILIVIKFRNRLLSFLRRQYRYRAYKNNRMFTVDKSGNSNGDAIATDVIYTYTDTREG